MTGSSRSTAPATTTTTNPSSPPACPSAPAKTPSTPPAASTSTTPPPGSNPRRTYGRDHLGRPRGPARWPRGGDVPAGGDLRLLDHPADPHRRGAVRQGE